MKDADRARAKRTIEEMADFGQSIVTLLVNGDREGAGDLVMSEFGSAETRLVALVLDLADLSAFVHRGWADHLGLDPPDAWRILMEQLAGWRASQEQP